jgi:hypothetical protein
MNSREEVAEFEKLEQQLHSFLREISELSRKKPNDAVNTFKLKFVNATLAGLNRLLGEQRPFDDFSAFDADDLPSNSDVVVILAQYVAAVWRYRSDHTELDENDDQWYWRAGRSKVATEKPSVYRYHGE